MKLVQISVQHLQIPFNDSFRHASAERHKSDAIIVSVLLDDGTTGFGEGCPRTYVTGENCIRAAQFIQEISPLIQSTVRDIDSLQTWIDANEERIDSNPAAWCGLELAIIDAFARSCRVKSESLLAITPITGNTLKYSAIIGAGSVEKLVSYLQAYSALQFDDYKIKLTGDLTLDINRLKQFARLSPGGRLRLDANNLWSSPLVAANYLRQLPGSYFAIEEPLAARDFEGLEQLSKLIQKKVILDESFTSRKDFEFLKQHKNDFIANFRVSKLGGLLRSMSIIDTAENSGISYVIGAHVGETSILTRAAMMLAGSNANYLVAREGAAGEHLLSRDICTHSIMFGRKGFCRPNDNLPGIGYEVNMDELSRYDHLMPGDTRKSAGVY
jgi:L-alanine-DL-glutamate epimerase-like enolase superfamily enzyme